MPELGSVAEQYRYLIGKEHLFTAPEEVGRASIRQFAMALGDSNALYVDTEKAAKGPYRSVVAPPTFVCESGQYYLGAVDESGSFTDRVNLASAGQEIRAGNDYVFHQLLRPADIITARWRISDISEREGRSGHLLFLVVDVTYTNQRGELLVENRETMVYRLSPSTEA